MATTTRTEKNDDRTGSRNRSSQQRSQPQDSQALATPGTRPGALARSLGAFGPFSMMRRLFDDLERLTGLDGPDMQGMERRGGIGIFMPTVEVMRRDDKLVVSVDLPGMSGDDIEVTIDDGALIVSGERRSQHQEQEGDVWRCERSYGRFQRVIPLPEGADPTTTEARFENGVLEISMRAPEQARQGRKIDIKTSGAASEKSEQTASQAASQTASQ
jgi:HSP20 family protein